MFGLFLPVIVLTLAFFGVWALDRTMLEKPGLALAPVGVLLLILVNGILWCFPVYRKEMSGWKDRAQRMWKAGPAREMVEPSELQPAAKPGK
jgi:hypothetical protein